MEVMCGMILGFDHDDETIFEAQVKFISQARVINVMLGMLSAIPKTPLYDRMVNEGRLDTAASRSLAPISSRLRLGREQLRNGFVHVLSSLNETAAYFERLEALYLDGRLGFSRGANRYWRRHPWHSVKARGMILAQALGLLARITWKVMMPRCARVSPADLAAGQGPARPEHPLDLGRQDRPPLPCATRWPDGCQPASHTSIIPTERCSKRRWVAANQGPRRPCAGRVLSTERMIMTPELNSC